MSDVAVITGGAGGMGLATAHILGRDHHILLADLGEDKLANAAASLRESGISCETQVCDVTRRQSVRDLLAQAQAAGALRAVVHTAGVSPQMAGPEVILRVNALGTVHVTEACLDVATEDFALVNVASMAAHLLPSIMVPTRSFPLAASAPDKFVSKISKRCRLMPKELYRNGMAYSISKQFVIWYSQHCAAQFGQKNARILSVSPGTFDTEMGRLEEKSGSMEMLRDAALKRPGKPEEIAAVLAFCASDQAGYLTGTDILVDGGMVSGRR
ncbi:SDR family oxidoreductase [Haliea sp. E17]|uniref:SDR family oxidoreductase n=1 Tax=Haliea sp. E17 TaxID=3401576 RepID=UPI003AAB76B3